MVLKIIFNLLKNSLTQKGLGIYEKIRDLFIKYLEMNKET